MQIILNRIINEFNKIYSGAKRVNDSLRLNGKLENSLDVANSAKLGNKSESSLSVAKAVLADKSTDIAAFDYSGNPVLQSGQQAYKKEHQLNVASAKKLDGKSESELIVDTSKKLYISPTQSLLATNIFYNPNTYQVQDSFKINGKEESALSVYFASNAGKLNNKIEGELSVYAASIATKSLKIDVGGVGKSYDELDVNSALKIRGNSTSYDLPGLISYIFTTPNAANFVANKALSTTNILIDNVSYDWQGILTKLKTDANSEIYKAGRIIADSTAKDGNEYKNWILNHSDFSNKILTLAADSANRAVRIGSSTTNYDIEGLKTLIKTTLTVDNATNAVNSGKLENNTLAQVKASTIDAIFNSASLVTNVQFDAFFGLNKVKASIQAIEPTISADARKLNGNTQSELTTLILNQATLSIVDGASTDNNTLKKIETNLNNEIFRSTTIDTDLEERISTVESNMAVKDNLTTLTSKVDNIIDGSGLKSSGNSIGSYIPNTDSNYISSAYSIVNSIDILDSTIFTTSLHQGDISLLKTQNKLSMVDATNSIVDMIDGMRWSYIDTITISDQNILEYILLVDNTEINADKVSLFEKTAVVYYNGVRIRPINSTLLSFGFKFENNKMVMTLDQELFVGDKIEIDYLEF